MKPVVTHNAAAAEYFFREGCFITELSNSPHDPALSIARARVEPGCVTRWHRLCNTAERYVIISGSGIVEIGDQPPCAVTAGDVLIIPALCPQRIRNNGDSDLIFIAICTPRFVPENYEDIEDVL